jgi:hypothetical protein
MHACHDEGTSLVSAIVLDILGGFSPSDFAKTQQ